MYGETFSGKENHFCMKDQGNMTNMVELTLRAEFSIIDLPGTPLLHPIESGSVTIDGSGSRFSASRGFWPMTSGSDEWTLYRGVSASAVYILELDTVGDATSSNGDEV